jgi:cytochrome c553
MRALVWVPLFCLLSACGGEAVIDEPSNTSSQAKSSLSNVATSSSSKAVVSSSVAISSSKSSSFSSTPQTSSVSSSNFSSSKSSSVIPAFSSSSSLLISSSSRSSSLSSRSSSRSSSSSSSSRSSSNSSSSSSRSSSSSVLAVSSSSSLSSSRSSSSQSSSSSVASSASNICSAPKPAQLSTSFLSQSSGIACAGCHGNDGVSGFAVDLPKLDFTQFSLSNFQNTVRNGKNSMPGFADSSSVYPQSALLNDYAYFAYDSLCGGSNNPGLSCSATNQLLSPKLRRLTKAQFANSIKSVFGGTYTDAVLPDFQDAIPTIGMSNDANALRIHEINMESVYWSVDAIVDQLLVQNTTVSGCVSSASNTCLSTILDTQGRLLWRRPLTTTEKQSINTRVTNVRNAGGNKSAQVEFLLKSLMLSPNFLYRSEMGALQNGNVQLTAYEIASLLSYALWNSPPDDTLYGLAANNSLLQQVTVESQITRMIADSRFDQTLVSFYRDYLKLERVKTVNKLAEFNFSDSVRQSLLTSAEMSLVDQVANRDRDILNVLAVTQFYVNADIDDLLGLSVTGSNQRLMAPPQGQRNTLLTHPAFLSVHSKEGASGIVKRGVYTLEQLLCQELGDPPPGVMEPPVPPDVNPNTTSTRDLLTMLHTSQVPCNSCHVHIDPAGFGYENYDAIGRFRTFEKQNVAIDASGIIDLDETAALIFSNNIEFTNALVSSPRVRACITKRFLENVAGETFEAGSCELGKFNEQLNANQTSIRQLALALAKLESLRLRND